MRVGRAAEGEGTGVLYLGVLAVVVVFCAVMAVRAAGLARRVGRLRKAMRALAERPGWELTYRFREPGGSHQRHYPWMRAGCHAVLTAAEGHRAEATVLVRKHERDDEYWLAVVYPLPEACRHLRLERGWSAAAVGVRSIGPGPYLPLADDVPALDARLEGTDLVERLLHAGAPAVSVIGDEACFLYQPLPEGTDLARYLDELAALLPAVMATALPLPAGEEADGPGA
ncbi:hypothetical protein KNE206_36780 [Kitasatospora sp. NE20-6]